MMTANQMGQPEKPTSTEQQLVNLGRVLQSLREEENVEVLIETTVSYLQEEFPSNLIWIGLYDRVGHQLFGKGGIAPKGETAFLRQRFVLNPGDLLEQVVIQQRPLGVADLRAETRAGQWRRVAHNWNIQGTIIFPIRYRDRCFGLALIGSERWGVSATAADKARLGMVLGEVALSLHQIEMNWRQTQTKRPEEPLLELLDKLGSLGSLEKRLEAVVEEIQAYMIPNRTSVYWFERQGRYFWRRVSNRSAQASLREANQPAAGITVQEVGEFYQALAQRQIVSIGEAHSSLKGSLIGKLQQRIRAHSLLAAPIFWRNELLGFLAVEGNEPRIWTEQDKNLVKAAAELISLTAPLETMETNIQEIEADAQLRSRLAQAVYSNREVLEILRTFAIQLMERFSTTRFLLLLYNSDACKYEVRAAYHPQNRRPLPAFLDALPEVDWELLERATEAVGVENLEQDLRFFPWHTAFLNCGVRSLLVCNCAIGHPPEGLVVLCSEATRYWTNTERELLGIISQQLGVILRQWQLHIQIDHQHKVLQSFGHCLRILEQTQDYDQLQKTALQHIASVLSCPLSVMLSWRFGDSMAEIIPGLVANSRFSVQSGWTIPIESEAMIQWSLRNDKLLTLSVDDIPADTRQWLNGSHIGQILVMALRTDVSHEPTGVVLLADHRDRQWSDDSLNAVQTLISQLAWSRRHLQMADTLQSTTEKLGQLNWYKHRRLEEIQSSIGMLINQMQQLGVPRDELTHTRHQQLLRQLGNTTASITPLLTQEQWQLQFQSETVPIASVLKRLLQRLDYLIKQRKLWVSIHGLAQSSQSEDTETTSSQLGLNTSVAIKGDIAKFELVLYELLEKACLRSPNGARVDVWCRLLDRQFIEVSITDHGSIEPQLIIALHQNTPKDILAPSKLDKPPALDLVICQNLMKQLGGELNFYQLQDGRLVSRLVLPLG
jgi:GAF domain-containing protein